MRHFLVAVSGLYIFLSVCKEYPCNPATSNMAFVAFRSDETDSILVKKYSKASNFTTLIDSFLLTPGNSSFEQRNDTLFVRNSFGTDNGFLSKYDYEITLPETGRQFLITAITEEYRSYKSGLSMDKRGCVNFISSYISNGQLISGQPNYYTFYFQK